MAPTGQRSLTRRAVLALALWAGFWGLGLLLAALLLWLPVAQAEHQGVPGLTGLLAGAGGVWVLWALRPRSWLGDRRPDASPRPLEREAVPALFAFLEDCARRSGAAAPDEVHLLPSATAFIGLWPQGLFRRRKQVVGLGLPLFEWLTREELASVLAHELGHRRGGDLLLGPWVLRTRHGLATAIGSLEGSAFFLDAPFRAYGQLFLGVTGAVSRGQELAADAHAAAVHGVAAAREALERVHQLGPAWEVYFHLVAMPLLEAGCRLPLLEGFRRFRTQPALRSEVAEALQEASQRRPDPADTHPGLEERLAALGPAGVVSGAGVRGECLELLGGEAAGEAAWYARAAPAELPAVSWEEVGSAVLLPRLLKRYAQSPYPPATTSPLDLAPLAADPRAFWGRVRAPGPSLLSPASEARSGERALADWFSAVLFTRGFVPRVRPGASLLLERDGERVVPAELVAELASGRLGAEAYRERAAGW